MRVITFLRRRSRDDRGVAAALTVVAMTALLAMAALVVDIGNAWQSRRNVITSTDAAALASARAIVQAGATPGYDCDAISQDYVTRNNANADWLECDSSNAGYVTVEAEVDVDYIFAPILGITGTTVESETTVSYKNATSIKDGGLRPIGLCIEALDDLTTADRIDPPAPPGPGTALDFSNDIVGSGHTYRIKFEKGAVVPPCATDPADGDGNWGMLDFDGVGGNDTKDWVMNGYDGEIVIGEPSAVVVGQTGNGIKNAIKTELDYVMTLDKFTLPIINNVVGNGNADFTIVNFVVVELEGYKTTPAPQASIDLKFLNETVNGGSGGPVVTDLGAYVIGICAVDNVNVAANCG